MTSEAQFLLECARYMVAGAPAPQPKNLRLPELLTLAEKHSVTPLLQHIPAFAATNQKRARFALALTAELLRLLSLFESRRIPVVPLKGPVLAASLHGGLASRSSSDLDLLVHAGDTRRAFDLLQDSGYRLSSTLPWPGSIRNKENELTFHRDDRRVSVDLHWNMIPAYLTRAAGPWNNLRSLTLAGRNVPMLCEEDLLLFLCLHGAKHLWEKLGWICDVAKLVQSRTDLNWQKVLDQADRRRCRRFLLLGLQVAKDYTGVQLPEWMGALSETDCAVQTRAQIVRDRLFLDLPSPPPGPEQIRFMLPLLYGAVGKLTYLRGMVLAPTEAEYRVLQLPSWLYWLYYPLRLARLTWERLN